MQILGSRLWESAWEGSVDVCIYGCNLAPHFSEWIGQVANTISWVQHYVESFLLNSVNVYMLFHSLDIDFEYFSQSMYFPNFIPPNLTKPLIEKNVLDFDFSLSRQLDSIITNHLNAIVFWGVVRCSDYNRTIRAVMRLWSGSSPR